MSSESRTTTLTGPDRFLICRATPVWRELIDPPPTVDERIPIIAAIFSDPNETNAVERLCGDDAQSFVNAIYEVLAIILSKYTNPN